eukprot:CAMPEP_0114603704 /NCGR_PEP_ID=MMETSP0168-20121206/168_1 /TAXON_ID=95228 ORGANISM="Vannella sp., Strain DIVA3 517/6/12" /NCGR_SAMPLE_ID=MMETSP0168 /ASSEMBLY_ACC=CAM_ASM_000044 /LENGTH=223 /DNA_ID=CAMNT_0001814515 /DNA_START=25 /DNA_END=693 /DNA_ORIENTATION=-
MEEDENMHDSDALADLSPHAPKTSDSTVAPEEAAEEVVEATAPSRGRDGDDDVVMAEASAATAPENEAEAGDSKEPWNADTIAPLASSQGDDEDSEELRLLLANVRKTLPLEEGEIMDAERVTEVADIDSESEGSGYGSDSEAHYASPPDRYAEYDDDDAYADDGYDEAEYGMENGNASYDAGSHNEYSEEAGAYYDGGQYGGSAQWGSSRGRGKWKRGMRGK